MIELIGWIGLAISFMAAIYHHYMYSNYQKVYEYIKRKYGSDADNTKFPSKDDHSRDARRYSYYTAFFAAVLIIINLYFRQ